MDFIRMLLAKTWKFKQDGTIQYFRNILLEDLERYEGSDRGNFSTARTSTLPVSSSPSGDDAAQIGQELDTQGIERQESVNADTFTQQVGPREGGYYGEASKQKSGGILTEKPSPLGHLDDPPGVHLPTTESPHTAAIHNKDITQRAVGKHVVGVSVPGAVTFVVIFEVLFFAIILIAITAYIRRQRRKTKDDVQKLIDGGDDVEKAEKSGEDSGGSSCSATSTPYSFHPGLSSALSENLHLVMPMMSPIGSPEVPKRLSFSVTPGTSIHSDIKSKQIKNLRAAMSEERPRSNTWFDITSDSKRALFAMTKSASTPEHLALPPRSASCTAGASDLVQTTIGKIDPNIYKKEELVAKFVGKWKQKHEKTKKETGKLSFKIHYDDELELLTVFIANATNLPNAVKDGNGDIFVKVALDPDHKKRSVSSKIERGSRNPEFNQNFGFRIARGAVNDMNLKFTVCEYDQYSHPIPIGRVEFALSNHDFTESPDVDAGRLIKLDLEKPESGVDEAESGELMVSLTYLPNAERVNLIIMKAHKLRLPEWGDKDVGRSILDTFVKITIMRCGKVMKHKNTKIVRRSCSPVYNEAFSIDRMRLSEMPECCFVLSLCVRLNHFRSHRVLGRCVVGGKDCAVGDGLSHWNEMADSPRSIVARWHKLQH